MELEALTPPLVVPMCFTQSLKILMAMKAHMPGGYAAVGDVLNPPDFDRPIMA